MSFASFLDQLRLLAAPVAVAAILGCTLVSPANAASGLQEDDKLWPGEMAYVLSGYSALEKAQIEQSIHYMRQATGFRIVPRTNQKNYLRIYSGKGCYSPVGMVGGEQAVSLDKERCLSRRNVVHTLMHALGFIHEQSAPNRDDALVVHLDNIQPAWREAFRKESLRQVGIYSAFNSQSIMLYPRTHPAMSIEGRPAFDCKPKADCDDNRVGSATDLSIGDLVGLGNMYQGKLSGDRDLNNVCPEEGWKCEGAKVMECKMERGSVRWRAAETCAAPTTCVLKNEGREGAACLNPASKKSLAPAMLDLGPFNEPPPPPPPAPKEKGSTRKP